VHFAAETPSRKLPPFILNRLPSLSPPSYPHPPPPHPTPINQSTPPHPINPSPQDVDDFCEEHPDVVVLCSSILSTADVLRSLPVQRLRRNTLFVDVLSVKVGGLRCLFRFAFGSCLGGIVLAAKSDYIPQNHNPLPFTHPAPRTP
jgi:hypothetical protein